MAFLSSALWHNNDIDICLHTATVSDDAPEHPTRLLFCCSPGQSLARLELQTALAVLLGRFKFELGPELLAAGGGMAAVQACMVYRLTVQPKNGMPLQAMPRV